MRVLSVTSEAYPLVKTGGLADVAGGLLALYLLWWVTRPRRGTADAGTRSTNRANLSHSGRRPRDTIDQ